MLFKKVPMKRYGLFPFLNLNGLVAHYIEYLVVGWKVTLKGYCSGPGSKRQRVVLHCCPTKHTSSKEGENLLNYSNSCNDIFVRWYILLLFSMVALLQDTIWNTWGPIDHTAIFLYGWYGVALKNDFEQLQKLNLFSIFFLAQVTWLGGLVSQLWFNPLHSRILPRCLHPQQEPQRGNADVHVSLHHSPKHQHQIVFVICLHLKHHIFK